MDISAALERSLSSEAIDFTAIGCSAVREPLVTAKPSARLRVEPIWTVIGDSEGRAYADYMAEHPSYDSVYVRQGLLERLRRAAGLLPEGYSLVVRAGHRPPAVQSRLLMEVMWDYLKSHPGATNVKALEHARMYVSDPDIKLPPHCCGAAVDIELYDTTRGNLADCGSPINLDAAISHLHSDKVTAGQRANRMVLLNAMLAAGFASYYPEWWHFSYGDEVWAWFYGKANCLYDVVEI